MIIRDLQASDLPGLLETLANLSKVVEMPPERLAEIFEEIQNNPRHFIFVAVDDEIGVIGTITLLIERKFIRDGALVGHIEDVAVRNNLEGKGIGGQLVKHAVQKAASEGCYKVILDCSEKNVSFYKKCGFKEREIEMRMDLPGV